MLIQDRISAFEKLGNIFLNIAKQKGFEDVANNSFLINPWFTKSSIEYAFLSLSKMLHSDALNSWVESYKINKKKLLIGVIIPSNIPLVGFYDFLCVLISGNIFLGKLSANNNILLPYVASLLFSIDVRFKQYVFFHDNLKSIDLLIATGGDNSYDYFNTLFQNTPRILRKNRNSVAVLMGNETQVSYSRLAHDIFLYFGLGCRNVSKLFLPRSFNFTHLKKYLETYSIIMLNENYRDNYNYQKSILTINSIQFIDFNNSILISSDRFNSPIGVLYYEHYNSLEEVNQRLKVNQEQIQCIVCDDNRINNAISLGSTQIPTLLDFPDGVDVMKFLVSH